MCFVEVVPLCKYLVKKREFARVSMKTIIEILYSSSKRPWRPVFEI